jgi:threonylcarbamoyladenosine tRNA methylthiotransferase MtaB
MPPLRVSILTFGCRVNQYESDMMRDRLSSSYTLSDDDPEIVILNACTVTALAERKARQAARRIRRDHPGSRVILVGCLADAVERGLTSFEEADVLAGNRWKPNIEQVVQQALSGSCGLLSPRTVVELDREATAGPAGRVRAFLKIQDGCARSCTYCRTTQVRGQPRSKSIPAVLEEARHLVSLGFQEIVLTGIDLAQYHSADDRLPEAAEALAFLPGLLRLRLASVNPDGITEALVKTCSHHAPICPHFHIPLQSGDDETLQAMSRGYTVGSYLEALQRVRRGIPQATFGTDIIVGFPGETDAAFENTLQRIREIGYANIHVFRFSPRRGTPAAALPNQVPAEVKRRRADAVLECWEDTLTHTLDNRIGSSQDVLVEEHREATWRGYTHDYLHVRFHSDRRIPIGSISSVRITGRTGSILEGVDDDRTDTC